MRICVIGTGYVGLVTSACLAEVGHQVTGLDVDRNKLNKLTEGVMPIHEPGLDAIVHRNMKSGHLTFTSSYTEAMAGTGVVFLAVGTPPEEDGSADLSYVLAAAREAVRHIRQDCILVTKSTVPVGTGKKVESVVMDELSGRNDAPKVTVASNPEFLREGQAVDDFLKPDRIIVGVTNARDAALLRQLYAPFNRNRDRMIVMDRKSAEITKYAANAMLATRISFMNEVANLCDAVGGDVEAVRTGLGADQRIGPHFLYAGVGYGGSCFPKDVRALMATGREHDVPMRLIEAVHKVNQDQRTRFANRIVDALAAIEHPVVALWGLAFKPGTDDMREAPGRDVINALLACGARIRAHDPAAMDVCRSIWPHAEGLEFADSPEACLADADVLVVVTEWLCFREPDWENVESRMRGRILFDGRNLYSPAQMRARGWKYHGIGRNGIL